MSEVTFVPQRGPKDCGVACLAMVTGLPYDEVLKNLTENTFNEEHGIYTIHMPQLLGSFNIATRTLFATHGKKWHEDLEGLRIAELGGHYVVVLPDNTVHDPGRGPNRQLADYTKAFQVWEIHDISQPPLRGDTEEE